MMPVGLRDIETALMFGDGAELFGATATPAQQAALMSNLSSALSKAAKNTVAVAAPLGAKLVVTKPTAKAATVSLTAPKLPQAAPPATKPAASVKVATPAPAATKPAVGGSIGLTAPDATGKAAQATLSSITPAQLAAGKAAEGTRAATPAPASTKPVATTALQGNFLDGGGAPLAAPNVQATYVPGLTAAPLTVAQRDANARAVLEANQLKLAAQNAEYARQRQINDAIAMATVTDGIKQSYEKAGIDLGLIPMGAKVLATGAAIIASGGAAAGAVGLTTGGAALASAAAADRLVAAVEKGGEIGRQAKDVIDEAKAAAAKGDKIAKQAVSTLTDVAKERIEKAIPKGVEQTLTATAKKAADMVASAVSGANAAAANLNAAAAAAAAAPSAAGNSPYYTGPLTTGPAPAVKPQINQATARILSTIQLDAKRPRWFVSDAGGVVNLDKATPKAGHGFTVWTTGEVVRV